MMFAVEHHADYIERRLVAVAAAYKWNLRSGHHERNGHEKLVVLQAEVRDTEIQRQIGSRQFRSKFFLQLPFFVVAGGVLEICRRVVAAAIVDLSSGNLGL